MFHLLSIPQSAAIPKWTLKYLFSGTVPGLTSSLQTNVLLLLPEYRKCVLSDSLDKCESEKCPVDVMRMS